MALPTKLTLEIVTPDRALVTDQVDEVELPGAEGYFGVLPGHAPMLSSLKVGELWYRIGDEKFYHGQRAGKAGRVVLARKPSTPKAAKKRAEERVARVSPQADLDFERARIALMKSMIRLQVASRARTRA